MKISSLFLSAACAALLYSQTPPAAPSHIDTLLGSARAKAAQNPPRPEYFNDLANALVRRAREKDDPAYLAQAEEAVNRSLRLAPANFEARKARVLIRLQQERYADALEEAQALNKEIPDDNIIYGLVCDAQLALGNYKEAEASAQRMIDLRQVSSPGLQRGAAIRESIGYVEGALDWWGSALRITSATDEEERAFILTQIARVNRTSGKPEVAARYAQEALALVPAYPRALTELALDRMADDKPAESVALLKQRLALSQDLASLYWLAQALQATGSPEAGAALARFQKQAIAAAASPKNANAILIVYEAEHGDHALALRLAKEAAGRRHDFATLDAYAWALYGTDAYADAGKQAELALAPGIRDARLYFHAGMIARKNGDASAASKLLRKSLEINAGSPEAQRAMQELAGLSKPSGT